MLTETQLSFGMPAARHVQRIPDPPLPHRTGGSAIHSALTTAGIRRIRGLPLARLARGLCAYFFMKLILSYIVHVTHLHKKGERQTARPGRSPSPSYNSTPRNSRSPEPNSCSVLLMIVF